MYISDESQNQYLTGEEKKLVKKLAFSSSVISNAYIISFIDLLEIFVLCCIILIFFKFTFLSFFIPTTLFTIFHVAFLMINSSVYKRIVQSDEWNAIIDKLNSFKKGNYAEYNNDPSAVPTETPQNSGNTSEFGNNRAPEDLLYINARELGEIYGIQIRSKMEYRLFLYSIFAILLLVIYIPTFTSLIITRINETKYMTETFQAVKGCVEANGDSFFTYDFKNCRRNVPLKGIDIKYPKSNYTFIIYANASHAYVKVDCEGVVQYISYTYPTDKNLSSKENCRLAENDFSEINRLINDSEILFETEELSSRCTLPPSFKDEFLDIDDFSGYCSIPIECNENVCTHFDGSNMCFEVYAE